MSVKVWIQLERYFEPNCVYNFFIMIRFQAAQLQILYLLQLMKTNIPKLNVVFKLKKNDACQSQIPTDKEIQSPKDNSKDQQTQSAKLQKFILNQNQLNSMLRAFLEHSLPKSQPEPRQNSFSPLHDYIVISNSSTKKQLKHGEAFKDMLDQRDIVLEHDFDFKIKAQPQEIRQKGFLKTTTYQSLLKNITDFMVQALANVLSVSFKSLNDVKLQERQVKNYAASNIMLNLQSVFTKTIEGIEQYDKLTHLNIQMDQLKADLIVKLQGIIKNILINLSDYYPQAPITGATLRMKNAINEVNRVNDEENDLIYTSGIRIAQYLKVTSEKTMFGDEYQKIHFKEDDEYIQFIMDVINSAIKSVQTSQRDSRQRVNKQIFTQFNKELFWLAQDSSFKSLVQLASTNSKNTGQQLTQVKKIVCSYFERITEPNADHLKLIQQKIKENGSLEKQNQPQFSYFQALNKLGSIIGKEQQIDRPSVRKLCSKINQKREKSIQELKDYAIGIKIPNNVNMFSRQQMRDKKFTVKHSSVLRVLTKWAQYLEDIFNNAEKHITMRLYSFKDIHNNLTHLSNKDKQKLISNLKQQAVQLNKKLDLIKSKNTKLISQIISRENDSFASNVFRFSDTRKISSKINAVLTSLMAQYLSVLIHHLLKAGQIFYDTKFIANINLVVFRVSDLVRAKFKCSESSFITLLKVMYLLDESESMKGRFQLVRIKNKLEDPANNIMINYMFMGKVVGQLQLSIQESKGKEKNYCTFSHFVYELIRGNFGIISQCAIMLSQLDPMINSCDKIYYQEKQAKVKESILQVQEQKVDREKVNQIFYCDSCNKLIINQGLKLLNSQQKYKKCIKCLIQEEKSNPKIGLHNFPLKSCLELHLDQNNIERVMNYRQLNSMQQKYQPFLKVDSAGQLEFVITKYIKIQLNHFLIEITPELLQKIVNAQKVVDFKQQINYYDISKLIKGKQPITQHFLFKIDTKEALIQILSQLGFKPEKLCENLDFFAEKFQTFRKEKYVIKSIKLKSEIINCDEDQQIWQTFEKVLKIYSIVDKDERQNQINTQLMFKRYNNLQFSKIKLLKVKGCEVKSTVEEITQKCTNIQELIMQQDKIKTIDGLNIMKNLSELYLDKNQLQNIDALQKVTSMKVISVSNNKLQNTKGLQNLTHIKQLILSYNKLKDADGLQRITTANVVNLQNNQLANIHGLKNIKTVNTLILSQNKLENVDSLINIKSIKKLQLYNNRLQNVDGLSNVASIDVLDLEKNELQTIQGLKNIQTINQLSLSKNKLKNVDTLRNITTINKLNISYNHLQNVRGLQNITSINQLYLFNNQLRNIECLTTITNIKELYLYNNQLQSIDGLRNIRSVNTLNLSFNQLQNLDGLQNITSVNTLSLYRNQLQNVDALKNLTKVLTLNLSYNQLKNVDGLRNITQVNMLILSNNQLQNVQGLKNIKTVSMLMLQNNKLRNVDSIRHLTEMNTLNLAWNELQSVDGLSSIANVQHISLNNNKLQHIDGLRSIKTAHTIKLQNNMLSNVDGLQNLTNINTLILQNNKLKNVDGLNNLLSINKLYLSNNQLQNIDGLSNLSNIDILKIQYNQLESVEGLKNCTTVNTLKLQKNKLRNINGLSKLTSVYRLQLRDNQLENVDALQNLSNVEELKLSSNRLRNINGLRNIKRLNSLQVSYNQLQNIEGLKNITMIDELYLEQNKELVVGQLPNTTRHLSVNSWQVLKFNFKTLANLKVLKADSQNRSDFTNLAQNVKLQELQK